MLNFIYLDILQTSTWLIPMMFPDDDGSNDYALNPQFDLNGFNSMVLVKNLGSTFVYLIVLILLFPLSYTIIAMGRLAKM